MAIELGLNRYVPVSPPHETEFQMRERRNRERTYLVLFVHDRSLSTQTGRSWMLPEDALVRHSSTWHEQGGSTIRPEDVIVSAFVQLRHIAVRPTYSSYEGSTDLFIFYSRLRQPTSSILPRQTIHMASKMISSMRSFSVTVTTNSRNGWIHGSGKCTEVILVFTKSVLR